MSPPSKDALSISSSPHHPELPLRPPYPPTHSPTHPHAHSPHPSVHVIGRVEDPGPYKAPLTRAQEAAALAAGTAARTATLLASIRPISLAGPGPSLTLEPTPAGGRVALP
jgi:hypothetical protein